MKVAITGGTSSVGKSLVRAYSNRGFKVIDISRSLGYDFTDIQSIVDKILPCDIFVNCLYLKDLQKHLLEEIWKKWLGTDKYIINISTCITLPAFTAKDPDYQEQKLMLEKKHWELISKNALKPRMYLIKFGDGNDNANWDHCGEYVVNSIETAQSNVMLFEMTVFK